MDSHFTSSNISKGRITFTALKIDGEIWTSFDYMKTQEILPSRILRHISCHCFFVSIFGYFSSIIYFLSSNNDLEFSKCNFCSISCFKIQIKKNSSTQQVNKFLKNSDPMISFDVYSIIHERKNAFGKWNGRGKNNAEKIVHWYVKSQFLSPTQYKTQTFLPFWIFLSSFFVVLRKGQLMIMWQ